MTETVSPVTAAHTAKTITEPRVLDGPHQIAAELGQGRWVVYAHEWLPRGLGLDEWKSSVAARCRQAGLTVDLATDLRSAVTIVMNTAAMPHLDLIEASVEAIQLYRRKQAGITPNGGTPIAE